ITAPRLAIAEPVFFHAQRIASQAEVNRNQINWNDSWLKFMAPDALINEQPVAEVLLVDEAAAIPVSLLEKLLEIYSTVVFATTVHGYEGTGRGFSLKFNKILDRHKPGWQQLYMTTPVRWSEGDPLEQWVDRVLCLDADICDLHEIETIKPEKCEIKLLNRDTLINDEAKLSSLFALLVYAHYRTQPSDFRYLLDSPDVRVYSLEYNQSIIAVALINQEGGFDVDLSTEIYKGSRRPKGNLLAQTLTFHAGCEIAATFNYARIMRIAVHPEIQLRGLGTYFLGRVIEHEQDKVDAIGVSFGATVELIRFWKKSGFEIVRMGFTRDHVSATHSSVMLKPVTKNGEKVFNNVRDKFQRYLPAWLVEPLSGCSSEIKDLLNDEIINDDGKLSEDDWKEINSFIKTNRGYETCMWPIIKLVNNYRYKLSNLDEISQNVIQTKILNAMNWKETVKICHLSGKTEGVMKLRNAIERMMD
ncbi:MAG: GNAT family N-acetyltransferase, partial [Gammaproteobacteria bacterium]|nr:GNAT family N-acetyltransferase [Gammaproteobacteria bacterium]